MNVIKYLFVSVALYCVLFSISCNDPSVIGGSIVGEEMINVRFVDTSTLIMKTVETESVRTFSPGFQLFRYMLGDLEDPVFGYSEAKLYTQINIGLNNNVPDSIIVNGTIDSAVLVLSYDRAGFYGIQNTLHTLFVHEILEDLDSKDTLFSNMGFAFDPTQIGEIQFVPNLDSILLTPHGKEDTIITVGPQLRIPIDSFFAKQMLDTSLWNTDTLFTNRFKGLYITSSASGKSLFGLNLSPGTFGSELNKLMVYITDDTVAYSVEFDLRGVRQAQFFHDYSGSIVEEFIGDEEMSDSLVFAQGMSGTDIELDIPYIRNFRDYLINKVELEIITVQIMEDDTSTYLPINNLVISRKNEMGEDVFIEDVSFAITNLNLDLLFGGFLKEDILNGLSVRKYTMNLTEEVLSMISDESKSTKFKISAFVKSERPNRSVIFGPKHSTFPARLKITFTEP